MCSHDVTIKEFSLKSFRDQLGVKKCSFILFFQQIHYISFRARRSYYISSDHLQGLC